MFPFITFASEGDSFTAQLFNGYKEMGPRLSLEVEKRINLALHNANIIERNCDKEVAYKSIKKELLRPVAGVIEVWANYSNKVEGHHVKYKDSIYKDVKFSENTAVHFGKFGMATFFSINGTLVSSDKFGHFFDEGHTYYKMINLQGKSLEDAFQKGIDLENGAYGFGLTRVYSHADLVANKAGYEFWNSLFNDKNNQNYISCVQGKFKLTRRFSFAEYVDEAWDESINCNEYSPTIEDRVNKAIASLEKKSGKDLACYKNKDKCSPLINKYGDQAIYLISSTCF